MILIQTQIFNKVRNLFSIEIINLMTNLFLLIWIQILVYFRWFFWSANVFADWWYSSSEYLSSGSDIFFWNSITSLGSTNETLFRFPRDFLYSFISWFWYDSIFLDKIFVFFIFIFISSITCITIFSEFQKNRKIFYILSLALIFNPYTLASNSQWHILLPIAWYFSILSFFYVWKYRLSFQLAQVKNNVLLFISLFFLAWASIYDFRYAYLFLIINIIFLFWTKFRYVFLYGSIFLLLQLYWIIPFFIYNSDGSSVLGRNLFWWNFWSLTHSMTAYHPFWVNFDQVLWFTVQPINIFSYALPLFFVGTLFFLRKQRIWYIPIILVLISIFLWKLNNPPFGYIYEFLYDKLPWFNAFRESSKFYFITYFFYLFIIAWFIKKYKSYFLKKTSIIIVLSLISISPLLWAISIFFGYTWNLYDNIDKPIEFEYFSKHLYEKGDILWYPRNSTWGKYPNLHNISYIDISKDLNLDSLRDILNADSNIAYIIIPWDPNHFFYYGYWLNKNYVLDKLLSSKDLELIYDTESMIVFKNYSYREKPLINAIYKKINPTQYSIYFNVTWNNAHIDFLESFNPSWKIYLKPYTLPDCSYIDSITHWVSNPFFNTQYTAYSVSLTQKKISEVTASQLQKNKNLYSSVKCPSENIFYAGNELFYLWENTVFDLSHTKIQNSRNTWIIDPTYIRTNYPKEYYHENPDGTIDIRMTLYFLPQSYFYIGLIISSMSLLWCFGYLFLLKRKKKKDMW